MGLLDLLCPPICPICGEVIEDSAGYNFSFCSSCLLKIVTPAGQFCRRCGGRRFVIAAEADECARCRTTEYRFHRVIVLGEYEHDLRRCILQMKTDQTGIKAIAAARTLAHVRQNDLEKVQADYIIPVPMYRSRRKDRGVNAPDHIAEELSRCLRIPVARNIVSRIRRTDLQYTLSRRARAENVGGAFAVSSPFLQNKLGFRQEKNSIINKTILLVDDILTTGSTCNEITKVLLSAGVKSVTVAVLARAEGNYTDPL